MTLGDLELRRAVTARSTPSRAASRWPTTQVLHRQSTTESDSGHLNRNRFNVLSKGNLSPIGDALSSFEYREGHSNSYRDEAGLVWELLPDSMNIYHQPAGATKPYPNKKLLHKDSSGGSSEAIRQPDGTYLTTGPLQGTYNYVHPEGLGNVGHVAVDVIPHYFSDKYTPEPPLDASTPGVDTYRMRYELEVESIGHLPDYSGATAGTFFEMIYIKDDASTRPAIASWQTTFGPWGHWRFVRWISPEMQPKAEARQRAQTGNKPIETIPKSEVKNVK